MHGLLDLTKKPNQKYEHDKNNNIKTKLSKIKIKIKCTYGNFV